MIRLREQCAIGKTAWYVPVRVTGDKNCRFRKFRSKRHHRVREIIATGPFLQSHVASHDNCIRSLGVCPRDRMPHRFNRELKFDSSRELGSKPERHAGRRHADDCNLNSSDFF